VRALQAGELEREAESGVQVTVSAVLAYLERDLADEKILAFGQMAAYWQLQAARETDGYVRDTFLRLEEFWRNEQAKVLEGTL
jgi:hypothetical protein